MRLLRCFLLPWLALMAISSVQANPPDLTVEVTLFAVPETIWRDSYEGKFVEASALWNHLNAETKPGGVQKPVSLTCPLHGSEPITKRVGTAQSYATGWTSNGLTTPPTVARSKERFIGTLLTLNREGSATDQPQIKLVIEHHLAPPVMHSINYANAATGTERDRLAIEYPEFQQLNWQGVTSVGTDWRLLTNALFPQNNDAKADAPAMRYLLFIKRSS